MAETPPVAPVENVVDSYFGTKLADPYRYMEQFKDPDVQAWVRGQADHAEKALYSLAGRKELLQRIEELDAGAGVHKTFRCQKFKASASGRGRTLSISNILEKNQSF